MIFSFRTNTPNKMYRINPFLNAGDNIRVRIASNSTAVGASLTADGTTYLKIVKLN